MSQWLKTLTGTLCLLTVLLHLMPQGKFAKYVRFYAGLLFFLIAAGPLWNLLAGEGELERLLQLEFLKEEYYDMEFSAAGMEELKNDQIKTAYHNAILRQIQDIATAYGVIASDIRISYDSEDDYLLTGISFVTQSDGKQQDTAIEAVKQEIASVYMLDPNRIRARR